MAVQARLNTDGAGAPPKKPRPMSRRLKADGGGAMFGRCGKTGRMLVKGGMNYPVFEGFPGVEMRLTQTAAKLAMGTCHKAVTRG